VLAALTTCDGATEIRRRRGAGADKAGLPKVPPAPEPLGSALTLLADDAWSRPSATYRALGRQPASPRAAASSSSAMNVGARCSHNRCPSGILRLGRGVGTSLQVSPPAQNRLYLPARPVPTPWRAPRPRSPRTRADRLPRRGSGTTSPAARLATSAGRATIPGSSSASLSHFLRSRVHAEPVQAPVPLSCPRLHHRLDAIGRVRLLAEPCWLPA
jgi:hypothetical protein